MRTRALAALVLAAFCNPAGAAEGKPQAAWVRLLDGSRDEVVRAEFVPSAEQPVGEVRLVRRGDAVVMQTVLRTKFLKRVVAEIRKKEMAAWPRDRQGHGDAVKYVDAVLAAQGGIQERFRRREDRGDRRQKMLIEFILSRRASIVAIAEPEITEEGGRMRVVSKRPIAVLELSRAYVRGNIYEIAWDALGLDRKESRDILEPMLPPESPAEAESSEKEGGQGISR
ncbi:MAG: hypothetical protein H6Q80_1422 [Deltaproteobacteria bacterium]|jgi:hypothetical protein|nr:hypothetical protein [Deltaproteobacteria bacterium]